MLMSSGRKISRFFELATSTTGRVPGIEQRKAEMSDISRHTVGIPWQQQAIQARCVHPSGTFVEFRKEEIEQSVPDRFEQMVRMYPDRLAIKTRNYALTYDGLNHIANRVARTILARRQEGEEPIALLFESDAPMMAAILDV